MTAPDTKKETEQSTIIIDPYNIQLRGRPGDLGEDQPASWGEVWNQVNRHLMRIASAPTRLISEVLEGATRVIRGLTQLPAAVVRRVDKAHVEADSQESRAQAQSRAGTVKEEHLLEATTRIEAILKKYRVQGYFAEISQDKDGRPTILLVKPADVELLGEVVRKALPPGSNAAEDR